MCEPGYPDRMGDPITRAEQERDELLDELAEADEQAIAWLERRKDLVIQASALNISARRIAEYVSLSDRGIGKMIKRERAKPNVATGGLET
jgi:hypothetical protein